MEKKQLLVTAAVIEDQGKFLITKRPESKLNGGRWEFPGGKVEFSEDLRECIEREIDEEMGIRIKALEPFEYSSHTYGNKHVVLLGFHCRFISGEIQKKEIDDHAWVRPEDLEKYDITEADHPFVEKLKR
ncbi:MAG: (deoxy)nucleoside triphosphate pyrophosphohydrolase [Nanobdellota archaeon]